MKHAEDRIRTVRFLVKVATLSVLVGVQLLMVKFIQPETLPAGTNHTHHQQHDHWISNVNVATVEENNVFLQSHVREIFAAGLVYPVVKVLHHKEWDCPSHQTWEYIVTAGGKMNEMFQETGFIRYFQNFYPLVEHWSLDGESSESSLSSFLHIVSSIPADDTLYFIPACFYTNTSLPVPFNHTIRNDGFRGVPTVEDVRTWLTFQPDQHPFRINKQSFWINTHPLLNLHWENLLANARTLRTDDSVAHAIGDVIIPVSVELEHCPIHLPLLADENDDGDNHTNRTTVRRILLFGCGGDHSKRFLHWRHDLYRAISAWNRTDVFASTGMSGGEYRMGFFRSKFCFVVPGDTVSTSQATRAMCGGCVPIFIVDDPRSLPFANMLNYQSFSLQKSIHQLLEPDDASQFLQELEQMVANGTYELLRRNLHQARDFFNYHRFDGRSPYAMAVLSMAMDQFHTDIKKMAI